MAADEVYLNVPEAERVTKGLADGVDNLGNAIDELKAALQRDHGCWSDDKIGKGFESSYLQGATDTQDGLTKLAKSLKEFADEGLPAVIKNVEELDSQYGEAVDSYGDALSDYQRHSER